MSPHLVHDHFVSLEAIFQSLGQAPKGDRLRTFLSAAGVAWHAVPTCTPQSLVRKPATRIVSLGGIPFVDKEDGLALANTPEIAFDVDTYRAASQSMMGMSGMMSYLNPSDRSPDEMFELLNGRNEMSVAHTVTVGILVAGISVAVENEFNSQRDIAHMSRMTVARSTMQNDPPLVVHEERDIPAFLQALDLARRLRSTTPAVDKDDLEAINLLYPASKATAFILTTSLRNFTKLLQQQHDFGKEREYRSALASIRQNLNHVWPTLF